MKQMTYEEARLFIQGAARQATPDTEDPDKFGIALGLDTMRELTSRLDNPQDKLRVIHVAGTNGKGSVTAFVSNILACSGYLTGRYVSPSLDAYEEKVQRIQGDAVNHITKDEVASFITRIARVAKDMVREGLPHPSPFELETAMAFLAFERWGCDFVVLEVGMGGRLDATNIVRKPICCVLTPISIDHAHFLGSDLASIAAEKAGIIKTNVPVVSSPQERDALTVIRSACNQQAASLTVVRREDAGNASGNLERTDFTYDGVKYTISLIGLHQIENACVALEVVRALCRLGYEWKEDAIHGGLARTHWRGRMEVLSRNPLTLLDAAHNPAAARTLRENVLYYCGGRYRIGVVGLLADKDYQGVVREMVGTFDLIYTITPDSERALEGRLLAQEFQSSSASLPVVFIESLDEAIREAEKAATLYESSGACNIRGNERTAPREAVIVIFGSFHVVGKVARRPSK